MGMGQKRAGRLGWIAGVLFGLAGCNGNNASTSEAVGSAVQALSPTAARTYGFESLQDWTPLWSTPTLSLSGTHSEGQSSLALQGGGWMQVQSRALSKEESAPAVVGFDVRLPPSPVNQWWYGSVDLYVDAPSIGVWAQFVGHAELTGLTPGQFHRVEFAVPAAIKTLLDGNYLDLRIRLAINAPSNEPRPIFSIASPSVRARPSAYPSPMATPVPTTFA